MIKILVTGCAGFIGSHVTDRLLKEGFDIVGVDNFNDYYDPKVKERNLQEAARRRHFNLYREDILNFEAIENIFKKEKPQKVIHLAARAGVRSSIADPPLYSQVNIGGTVNLLKLSTDFGVNKFIFSSSSSVYGNSKRLPFSENDQCDQIISPYGASKRAAEFWVESFWRSYGLKSIILRFFTVYGPRGRPDMAPALFTKAVLEGKPIKQFGDGTSSRDYTYIDDIVNGIVKALNKNLDFEIINLGNNRPVTLSDFIKTIEKITGKGAKIKKLKQQPGDVVTTWASVAKAKKLINWEPKINLVSGLNNYFAWLRKKYARDEGAFLLEIC